MTEPGRPSGSFVERYGRLAALLLVLLALLIRVPGTMVWWLNPDERIYFSIATQPTLAGFWEEVVTESRHDVRTSGAGARGRLEIRRGGSAPGSRGFGGDHGSSVTRRVGSMEAIPTSRHARGPSRSRLAPPSTVVCARSAA